MEVSWGKQTQSYLNLAANINDAVMEEIMDEAKAFANVDIHKDEDHDADLNTVPTFHLARDLIHPSLASMNDPSSSLTTNFNAPCPISLLQSTLPIQLGRLNGISVHIIKCDYVTLVSPEY